MKQLVFWLIRMFIHQTGMTIFLCHGTFSLHSIINLSRPAFAFGIAITSRNSFLLAHAVGTKDKQYKNTSIQHTTNTNHMTYMHMAVKKSISLPFCKPVLFPNGFKTKNHLGNHVFCMLTKLHWSNTLCLIHLDKAKWISRTGSNSWSKTVAL